MFLTQHRVPRGWGGGGHGELMVEDEVREITGGQAGWGSAGPCKDQECYLDRWQPLTRRVTLSDLYLYSKSLYHGVKEKRLPRK